MVCAKFVISMTMRGCSCLPFFFASVFQNICRSSTLSTMAELYGRTGFDWILTLPTAGESVWQQAHGVEVFQICKYGSSNGLQDMYPGSALKCVSQSPILHVQYVCMCFIVFKCCNRNAHTWC